MSNIIIRLKGQDYPYFTDKIEKETETHIEFVTINKQGKTRRVQVAKSEIASQETNVPNGTESEE